MSSKSLLCHYFTTNCLSIISIMCSNYLQCFARILQTCQVSHSDISPVVCFLRLINSAFSNHKINHLLSEKGGGNLTGNQAALKTSGTGLHLHQTVLLLYQMPSTSCWRWLSGQKKFCLVLFYCLVFYHQYWAGDVEACVDDIVSVFKKADKTEKAAVDLDWINLIHN